MVLIYVIRQCQILMLDNHRLIQQQCLIDHLMYRQSMSIDCLTAFLWEYIQFNNFSLSLSYPGGGQVNPYPTGGHHMPVPVSLQGTAPQVPNEPSSPSRKHTSGLFAVILFDQKNQLKIYPKYG